jgi:ABC-type glycerol-3-phosphate transport system permease component
MNRVLLIAVLLRFMDSFMIYTEPFVVTGGGPGNSTTFLSIELVKMALGQFDLGKAAAMSMVYNIIVLIVCWIFYTVMTNAGVDHTKREGAVMMHTIPGRALSWVVFGLPAAADLLARQYELQDQCEIVSTMTLWPHQPTLENYTRIFTDPSWYSGYINSLKYVIINTVLSISFALPAAYAFSRYRFLGDKHLFFWLLSNRMAPPAVFALPFFNLYSAIGLFDTPWPWRWRIACSTCRWRCGSSKASCPACRARSTRRPISTATRSRASS